MSAPRSFALYAEVDANLIDGSSAWLQSAAAMLAAYGTVAVALRVDRRRDVVLGALDAEPAVELLDTEIEPPHVSVLPPVAAAERLVWEDERRHFDLVLVRGDATVEEVLGAGGLGRRLWAYFLAHDGVDVRDDPRVARWTAGGARLVCQTGEVRDALRKAGVEALVMPPTVPDAAFDAPRPARPGDAPRIAYAGKLSPDYGLRALAELFALVREAHAGAELHVAGDKIGGDAAFGRWARGVLQDTEGVTWHGALSRAETLAMLRGCDIGFGLRAERLSTSSEMSTKALEYAASRCAPLVSPGPATERVFGAGYPLTAADAADAAERVLAALSDPARLERARALAFERAQPFRQSSVGAALFGDVPAARRASRPRATRVLVAAHQRSFTAALEQAIAQSGAELRHDTWLRHGVHVRASSRAARDWADVVLCEWCVGNAVWHAAERRPGARVVVRFHRMELETEFPGELDLERVDRVVFVAEHVRRSACERFGWDPADARFGVIPNTVDWERLDRPKLDGAEFTLGMVGLVPSLKRLDLALDLLERLRAVDDRYRLWCKGPLPWEMTGLLRRGGEYEYYARLFARLRDAPLLRGAVFFDPPGPDVPEFLRRVGWILSLSDVEGHATALAEGMAARCVPVVLQRPGAGEQYAEDVVHPDVAAAAQAILRTHGAGERRSRAERAREETSGLRWSAVKPRWSEALGLDLTPRA